ncbi:amino acid ABC transporter periplasmic protein [Oleiphilus messinensis]|uniref:Amino acid ABC transporter periplasmic protein n=1 Tax=Oleiphilus messinensis TaxID=141451 RepID=A0A1Y0I7E1_9GAMM|nr:transporter substrate-binding domain-containing protein [Oleiphilus messinensis]ARU55354.1 amino acid ABC transporter periplasmic protein [Oleiphilus messinensis]
MSKQYLSYAEQLKITLIILALLVLPGVVSPIQAETSSLPKHLTLAASEDFAPFVHVSSTGKMTGIDFEIIAELYRRLDISIKVILLPRPRITTMLLSGELDGVVSTTTFNDTLAFEHMWSSIDLYKSSVSVFTLKSVSNYQSNPTKNSIILAQIRSGKLLKNSRIGMLNEFDYTPMGVHQLESLSKQTLFVRTDTQLINLLDMGRITYVITEDISFAYQARINNLFAKLEFIGEVFHRGVRTILRNELIRQFPALQTKINSTISSLVESDYIASTIYHNLRLDPLNEPQTDGEKGKIKLFRTTPETAH